MNQQGWIGHQGITRQFVKEHEGCYSNFTRWFAEKKGVTAVEAFGMKECFYLYNGQIEKITPEVLEEDLQKIESMRKRIRENKGKRVAGKCEICWYITLKRE